MPPRVSHKRGSAKPIAAAARYAAGPPIDSEDALVAGVEALRRLDPTLVAHMLELAGQPPLRLRAPGFQGLCAIIVSQQVSTASANAIFGRLSEAVKPFEPDTMLRQPDEVLRGCGLSIQKIRALRSIAEAITNGALPLDALPGLPAEEAARALLAIKGIGPWTADVFLLFCLGHADAWPAGDIALQEAARVALRLEARPGIAEMQTIGERWRPHRGVAARLLWGYYRAIKSGRDGISLNAPKPDPADE